MPLVLDAAYDVGYTIGQVIGVLILVGIPAGIGYGIYRLVRKKPATTPERATYDYKLEPMAPERTPPQGGPCPGCGNQAQGHEVYCANCGRQLQPIP